MTPLVERCREMVGAGGSLDDLLGLMRREGQSRTASIGLLMELMGMSLKDAKTAVHASTTWEDLREEAETFHEQLERAAQQQHNEKP